MDSSTEPSSAPFPPQPIVTLQDGITLRPYHATADIATSVHHANNPRIAQWMTNAFPHPYTTESAQTWISFNLSQPRALNFVIAKDDALIGGIGLKPMTDIYSRTMVIGYWIGEEYWGRGIGKLALKAFTSWTFKEFPEVERIEAEASEGNVGSEKVLLASGFTFEGTMRKRVYKNGVFFGSKFFGVLRDEWLD